MSSKMKKMWRNRSSKLFAIGVACMLAAAGINLSAQEASEKGANLFSIYLQNGLAGAKIPSLGSALKPAPAVGFGADFTLSPWVRIGGEYLWSNHFRQQKMAQPDENGKIYGNFGGNFHSVQLNLGFNMIKILGLDSTCCMGLWISTGAGATLGSGLHYELIRTAGEPKREGVKIDAPVSIGSKQTPAPYKAYYIPVALHFEVPLNHMVDIGLKLQANTAIKTVGHAPKNQLAALVSLRYNFGRNK